MNKNKCAASLYVVDTNTGFNTGRGVDLLMLLENSFEALNACCPHLNVFLDKSNQSVVLRKMSITGFFRWYIKTLNYSSLIFRQYW